VEDGLIVDTDILIDLLRKKDYAVSLIKKLEDKMELATSAINVFVITISGHLNDEIAKGTLNRRNDSQDERGNRIPY